MKKSILLLALIWQSVIFGCEKRYSDHEYICIVNKSDKNIRCEETWKGKITPADTLHQCRKMPFRIWADSMYYLPSGGRKGWENDFRVIPYIQFLIMDDDTYMQYLGAPCDVIRKNVPILHRYQLTLENLERMNWTVVYPPEE